MLYEGREEPPSELGIKSIEKIEPFSEQAPDPTHYVITRARAHDDPLK